MRCTSPRTVAFKDDGKTLAWSPKSYSNEYAPFQLPCGKCTECRLEYARQWAIRCVHEAQMHEKSCFVTLTYSDEHLKSPKLIYKDFQNFMKKLRKIQVDPMGFFVTGEYGDKQKRPHWHALIFGWEPPDRGRPRRSESGHLCWPSEFLDKTWGKGRTEFGTVTFDSAGYCARYAAKKLVHGRDQDHDFHPISKKSSKHAIGKKWLEVYWPDVFTHGKCVLRDGTETSIPRYYERWLKEKHPTEWLHYVTHVKFKITTEAEQRAALEKKQFEEEADRRRNLGKSHPLTKNETQKIINEQKFKLLQSYLKL